MSLFCAPLRAVAAAPPCVRLSRVAVLVRVVAGLLRVVEVRVRVVAELVRVVEVLVRVVAALVRVAVAGVLGLRWVECRNHF